MDSGLGSDEDRRGGRNTKEQKQLRNQQLLSGCFIDAASLSDEAEVVVDQRRNDERRQGALIFQSSIPQFSMLQMTSSNGDCGNFSGSSSNSAYAETSTPYNSIVHLDPEEEAQHKSPLGFYVDLNDVPDPQPKTPPSASAKKNIFSMVIDFEGPKKDKPSKLSSSLVSYKKSKHSKGLTLAARSSNGGSLSSSVSSISSVAGPSRQVEEDVESINEKDDLHEDNTCSNNNASSSSKSSSSSEHGGEVRELKFDVGTVRASHQERSEAAEDVEKDEKQHDQGKQVHQHEEALTTGAAETKVDIQERSQFVRLSDLECQKPRIDLNFTPRMSKSIPESHWVESPLLMSRSAGYRSAPHPMEPEAGELSDSGSSNLDVGRDGDGDGHHHQNNHHHHHHHQKHHGKSSVQRLGTDLLRMFLEEVGPDVTVEVDGHRLRAHKCILASRCQYFAALLSGNWLEASGNVISLQGFSYESVYFALCHIYSGAAHVPDSISLVELASLADMLGLEGLKEVVEHALKQRHCHNFHKPCAGCCTGVLEVLPLAAAYGLDDLYQKCLQWITQHFVRVWPSRAFAGLPRELREKCYQQHVVHMTADKVLETIVACDKIVTTLPALRWADPVSQLVLQLSDACHLYHRQHFAAVLASPTFLALDAGLGWGVGQVEDQMVAAARNLGVEQACRSYSRCCKMLEHNWSRPFNDMLYKLKMQLEQCLVAQSDRLIRSNAWLRLDSALRCRIKDLTPNTEPVSRLPRATPKRTKKLAAAAGGAQSSSGNSSGVASKASHSQSPTATISSSDSSRNSSPGVTQAQSRLHASGGSPSLRRSLLLAARAPQVPPSPSAHRRSTLTQPTAASAAKSAPSRNVKPSATTSSTLNNAAAHQSTPRNIPKTAAAAAGRSATSATAAPQTKQPIVKQPVPLRKSGSGTSTKSMAASVKKTETVLKSRKPISRSGSPLKVDSRSNSPRKLDSKVTSPIKNDGYATYRKTPSPKIKPSAIVDRPKTPKDSPCKKKEIKNEEEVVVVEQPKQEPIPPVMQRSSTFLRDEPTVFGKI